MKRILGLCFAACIGQGAVFAQSIPLAGTVAIQNSRYETGTRRYVKGASIRAPFAKASVSDREGRFTLDFVSVQPGASVRLDVMHDVMEVVNAQELERVIVGRSTSLEVVMAEPEKLAAAQMNLYGVAVKAIEAQFAFHSAQLQDTNLAVKDRIQALSGLLSDTISVIGDAMESLAASRTSALSSAALVARELAMVDLDRASAMYVVAYGHFRNGHMDSVLRHLDERQLDQAYAAAIAQQKEGLQRIQAADVSIRHVVQSRMLKVGVLRTRFDLNEVLSQLELINVLQQEHPDVFDSVERALLLRELAHAQSGSAKYDVAWTNATTSHDMLVAALGPAHKEVATALALLAVIKKDMGEPMVARTFMDSAYAMSRSTMQESDPALLDLLVEFSGLLILQAENDTALVHLQHALNIALGLYNEPSDEVATVCESLASATSYMGNFIDSERWGKRALWNKSTLIAQGLPGVDLSMTYDQLGYTFDELSKYDSAAYFFEQSISLLTRMYGPDHPAVAQGFSNLGRVRSHQGNYTLALEYYSKSVATARSVLGDEHPTLGTFLHNEAAMLNNMGKTEEAIAGYDECIRIWSKCLGPEHPNVGYARHNKGYALASIRENQQAMVEYREALRIRRLVSSGDNPDVSNTLNCIGTLYGNMRQLDSALYYVNAGLAMDKRIFGEVHFNIAAGSSLMASMYFIAQNDSMALVWWARSLDVYWQVVGKDHPHVAVVEAMMAQVSYALGDKEACLKYATDSNRIQRNPRSIWYSFRCLEDKGDLEEALILIVELSDLLRKDPGQVTAAVTAETITDSLRETATKLGRTDVLKEFGLE